MTAANRDPSARPEVWSSRSAAASEHSTLDIPSAQSSYSSASFHSDYSSSLTELNKTATTTIISEVPPAKRQPIYIPIEKLLDFEERSRKPPILCCKYDEIGNPHARKRKNLKRGISANKKWNRTVSYANSMSYKGGNQTKNLNFMDKQANSIYNSGIDEQLSPHRGIRKEIVTKSSSLPPLVLRDTEGGANSTREDNFSTFKPRPNKTTERMVLNTMIRLVQAKFKSVFRKTIQLLLCILKCFYEGGTHKPPFISKYVTNDPPLVLF